MAETAAGQPGIHRLLKSAAVVATSYIAVSGIAALPTLWFGRGLLAVTTWILGAAVVAVLVWRRASDWPRCHSRVQRIVAATLISLGVAGVAAFVSFVLIVNIWEWLGMSH
jgi:hypothetical protein